MTAEFCGRNHELKKPTERKGKGSFSKKMGKAKAW
jgi:hypothetical protein